MNKYVVNVFSVILSLLLLAACTSEPVGDIAIFEESEPGQAPYKTRMIATRNFLRIDDGKDEGDFLLYDRKNKSIHNVNNQERLILNIRSMSVSIDAPIKLDHETVNKKTDAPELSGKKVSNFLFITNKQVCFDVYVADSLLTTLHKSLAEYRRALSGEQAVMLTVTPKEILNGCDLANNIYLPDRHLSKGFPVRQQEFTGRSRMLVDYKEDEKINSALFRLPEDYKQLSPQKMRSGMEAGQ